MGLRHFGAGSLGVPGLSGFAAEVQIVLAVVGVYLWVGVLVGLGIAISTGLFAWTIVRVAFGERQHEEDLQTVPFPGLAYATLVVCSALLGIVRTAAG